MKGYFLRRISRRATLAWLAGMSAAAAAASLRYGLPGRSQVISLGATERGYGPDPDLLNPTVTWQRMMTQRQKELTAVLADLILPGTESAPRPSALGVHDFVDEWVSAPYPDQQRDRAIILEGLARLDEEAARRWGIGFAEISEQRKLQILSGLSVRGERSLLGDGGWLFRRLRAIVVGAYYSTPEGFADIGYVGNVALDTYPAPTESEKAILDEELRKLGL